MYMKRNTIICALLCLCLAATAVLAGCGSSSNDETTAATTASTVDSAKTDSIDYMALVNKTHALPDDWEDKLETVHMTNSVGDDVEVEKKAYDAYLELKAELEKEGVYVDLDSARRSVAEQQRIMDDFTEKYGADYAAKTVAKPGYSEHHTGLALDLYLIIDGKDVVENEDMIQYPEIWSKIHAKLADYGFILRYLDGSEHITVYGYEPWHIRYLDNVDTAKEITSKGVTFEEYLGAYTGGPVSIDYGTSEIYTEDELKDAVIQIKCKFAFWGDVDLKSIRYAGDEKATDEMLAKMNEINPDGKYTQVAEFLMDFHTPKEIGELTFNPDADYTDYQWWLARTADGGWEIVTFGYGY
ncbi:MAG: M15 family metallopeptidase [Ruminococcus sp.]|nr:M15 family metallopeptidase [Ruminococcus sp.]